MYEARKHCSAAVIVIAAVTLLTGCEFIGGGDTVVSGNDNIVVRDDVVDRVASYLARMEVTPAVTDDEIVSIYTTIRDGALKGDLRASLVILKVAGLQRQPAEEEDE